MKNFSCFHPKNPYSQKHIETDLSEGDLIMSLNFNALVERFGETVAWHCLVEIEKAANLKPRYDISDPEARLAYALNVQDTFMVAA